MLADYTIENKIGASALTTVYLAKQNTTHQTVVLKRIEPIYSQNPSLREKFLAVGERLTQRTHPHRMPILEVGATDEHCYLILPYYPGHTLKRRLRIGFPVERCLEIIQQLAAALDELHSHDLVHGGVRTHNIYYDLNAQVVLSEPDIVRLTACELGLAIEPDIATATYYSPEQTQARCPTASSDFYSLGVILYELLQKNPPFIADTVAVLLKKHYEESIPVLTGRLAYLQPLLNQLLCKKPDFRRHQYEWLIASLQQLQNAAKPAAATRPDEKPALPSAAQKREKQAASPYLLLAGLSLGAISIGAGIYFLQQPTTPPVPPTPVPSLPTPTVTTGLSAVETLLAKAELQISAQRLIDPPENNAYETYQQILQLEAQQPQAKQGLEKIAQILLDKATQQQQHQEWYDSLDTLEQALTHFPDHAGLIAIKQQVQKTIATHPVPPGSALPAPPLSPEIPPQDKPAPAPLIPVIPVPATSITTPPQKQSAPPMLKKPQQPATPSPGKIPDKTPDKARNIEKPSPKASAEPSAQPKNPPVNHRAPAMEPVAAPTRTVTPPKIPSEISLEATEPVSPPPKSIAPHATPPEPAKPSENKPAEAAKTPAIRVFGTF